MKTVKERHEEQRKVKLALIDKQVKAGPLAKWTPRMRPTAR